MRHQTKRHRIGRTHAHRKATLAALSTALITHKRITTTLAKAKALRVYVEPILNRSKEDTTHNRRQVFRHLHNKEAIKELFGSVAESIGDRPGGYTRIVKLGERDGDATEMAIIEIVDFNDVRPEGATGTRKRRRTRRGGAAAAKRAEPAAEAAKTAEPATPAPAEEPVETVDQVEAPEDVTPVEQAEEVPEETPEQAAPENESTDEPEDEKKEGE